MTHHSSAIGPENIVSQSSPALGALPPCETAVIRAIVDSAHFSPEWRRRVADAACDWVKKIRATAKPGLMEVFLAEYGLSTREGVALMCLAEALLRVPDAPTIDALIEDKITPGDWAEHLGHSASPLVNASTWGLLLTGRVLGAQPGVAGTLRSLVRRLGEPVIRKAVGRAMQEMGRQFVLGETIESAVQRAQSRVGQGYTHSYDMLGEAALTDADACHFARAYSEAIAAIAPHAAGLDIRDAPGISVKLSALYPRYETRKRADVLAVLVPRVLRLALQARDAGMGFTIDAEEAERLEISLDVIDAVLSDPRLAGWDGFGVVVQAYGLRAPSVLDWLHQRACQLNRKICVRLVKGAYWDAEIKRAQVEGLAQFPVFTRKTATDIAYIDCARRLLAMAGRVYPQFATHNAHSVAAILELAGDNSDFEFQKLHGMGDALHGAVMETGARRCRIYAPVGPHRDLLAYLVRRLLENGANSSFVNRIVDNSIPAQSVAPDPFAAWLDQPGPNPAVARPAELFAPERQNAAGWDLQDPGTLQMIAQAREAFATVRWSASPLLAASGAERKQASAECIRNPAIPEDIVGEVRWATLGDVATAYRSAQIWEAPVETRAKALERAADRLEADMAEAVALLAREAGKTLDDAIAELREAVDFLRYYAAQARHHVSTKGADIPRGVFGCISPWNFPLAITLGQISAALAAGNAVLAKPAETTNLVAGFACKILHDSGVPRSALQVLPGAGPEIGAAIAGLEGLAGLCFTGSTATAQRIAQTMAPTAQVDAPLIAETGGLNAMIVDSTALPEQAVRDIITSAFRSNGQRCSALRMLYVQEDCAEPVLTMLKGAMDMLRSGDPWQLDTDIGPAITAEAARDIRAYVAQAEKEGRLLKRLEGGASGAFTPPALIRVAGIDALEGEVFGPVLHVATYRAEDLDEVLEAVNATGYGLTLGVQTRIDARVQQVVSNARVGNIYVNRNQVGAVVGSQPFGGENLSGTGPKAGGPEYLPRFFAAPQRQGTGRAAGPPDGPMLSANEVSDALAAAAWPEMPARLPEMMPGPTGELNSLSHVPRGPVLCLGPGVDAARMQAKQARAAGCPALVVAQGAGTVAGMSLEGCIAPASLSDIEGFASVALWAGGPQKAARAALAARPGALLPLFTDADIIPRCRVEQHVCVDTTASGGNAALLLEAGSSVPET